MVRAGDLTFKTFNFGILYHFSASTVGCAAAGLGLPSYFTASYFNVYKHMMDEEETGSFTVESNWEEGNPNGVLYHHEANLTLGVRYSFTYNYTFTTTGRFNTTHLLTYYNQGPNYTVPTLTWGLNDMLVVIDEGSCKVESRYLLEPTLTSAASTRTGTAILSLLFLSASLYYSSRVVVRWRNGG